MKMKTLLIDGKKYPVKPSVLQFGATEVKVELNEAFTLSATMLPGYYTMYLALYENGNLSNKDFGQPLMVYNQTAFEDLVKQLRAKLSK